MGFTAPYLKLPPDAKIFKPKAGTTMLLDIIPYVVGKGNPWAEEGATHYERTFYVHRGIGANNDSFLCPRMTKKGLRCPVCEFRMNLMKDADEDKEEMVKDLAPKQRQLFNVINRKDPEAGIQLWDFSYHNFGKMLDARLRNSDEDEEWEKFFFLEGGFTLRVGFAEKSFGGHSFPDAESIDFKPRKEDLDEDLVEEAFKLDTMLVLPEYDDLKKTLLESKPDTDDDDDDDAPKSKRGVKPKSSKDDDDDDEDDDDKPDDDEDDEPKKKKKEPKDADDDWEDFDDDDKKPVKKKPVMVDDDDDDAPKSKSRKVVDDDDDDEPKKKSKDDDDDDDLDVDDEDEPKKSKKPKNRFAKQKGDKGWDKDDDDEDDAPKSKPKKKAKASKDEEDDD